MAEEFLPTLTHATERDIDLLLVEELYSNPRFVGWFAKQAQIEGTVASSSVLHSKRRTRNRREIDIFCEMTMADGSSAAMLIENKLDAMEQADQAESYREELEVLAKRYQQRAMLLVCPEAYRIRHGRFASKFDVVITYEEMAVWLAAAEPETKREASRYQFRRGVIAQAVHKARRGYEPVPNSIIGDFNALYCELLARIALGIVPGPSMKREANPDESVSMIFDAAVTFADLPTELRPRRFAHELGRGQSHRANYVAVTFSRWGRAFEPLRAMFEEDVGDLGASFATKAPSKRTPFPGLTMWVPTPPVDNQAIFSSQISNLTTGIVQAVQFRKWLLNNGATLSRWKDAVEGELRS